MSSSSTPKRPSTSALASVDVFLNYVRWAVLVLFGGYLLSGLTVVRSDEVAVVLRFGALAGGTPAAAVRHAGLHYTLPRPIDEVVRVNVEKIYELEITELKERMQPGNSGRDATIDPTYEGYVLTGDQNIVQVDLVARYNINDPVAFALHQSDPEALLESSVMAATVRSIGEVAVDNLLSEGRAQFVVQVVRRAQERLDRVNSGISVVSIEVNDLGPPRQVQNEFEQVQNAFIDMETKVTNAKRLRESMVPQAKASRDQKVGEAKGYAAELLAQARGDAAMWRDLYAEYRENPQVVRERLFIESVEASLPKANQLRFVPPPRNGGRYNPDSFRLSISAGGE